jgi:hypothetical protein
VSPEPLIFFTDRDLGTRFPALLRDAGLDVRVHRDLFAPDCADEVWLERIGNENWFAISHDSRIRYKTNELAAVRRHHVRLLIVIGKAPYPELARNFIATIPRIRKFIDRHPAPWVAKVYRPTPAETRRSPRAAGSISLWYPS